MVAELPESGGQKTECKSVGETAADAHQQEKSHTKRRGCSSGDDLGYEKRRSTDRSVLLLKPGYAGEMVGAVTSALSPTGIRRNFVHRVFLVLARYGGGNQSNAHTATRSSLSPLASRAGLSLSAAELAPVLHLRFSGCRGVRPDARGRVG